MTPEQQRDQQVWVAARLNGTYTKLELEEAYAKLAPAPHRYSRDWGSWNRWVGLATSGVKTELL